MSVQTQLVKIEERVKDLKSHDEKPIEGLFRDDTKEPPVWYVYRLIEGVRKEVVITQEEAEGNVRRWHEKWGKSSPYVVFKRYQEVGSLNANQMSVRKIIPPYLG